MDNHKNLNKSKFLSRKRFKNSKSTLEKAKVPQKDANLGIELSKNWDRYEELEEEDVASKGPSQRDFGLLSQGPIMQGNYFRFKKDRYFLPNSKTTPQTNDMFKLDLNRITMAIKSVAFYKHVGMDPNIFTEEEIGAMDEAALKNRVIYESFIANDNKPVTDNLISSLKKAVLEENKVEIEDEEEVCSNESVKNEVTKDLEVWLDDILN